MQVGLCHGRRKAPDGMINVHLCHLAGLAASTRGDPPSHRFSKSAPLTLSAPITPLPIRCQLSQGRSVTLVVAHSGVVHRIVNEAPVHLQFDPSALHPWLLTELRSTELVHLPRAPLDRYIAAPLPHYNMPIVVQDQGRQVVCVDRSRWYIINVPARRLPPHIPTQGLAHIMRTCLTWKQVVEVPLAEVLPEQAHIQPLSLSIINLVYSPLHRHPDHMHP